MTLEELLEVWEADCAIDQYQLGEEALRIPKLHSKYYRMYMKEKQLAFELQAALRVLKLHKSEFYTMGPHAETPKEWKLPDSGRVPKTAVAEYLEADKEVIKLTTTLAMQMEKAKFLESIINGLRERGFAIKNAIDMLRFQSGA